MMISESLVERLHRAVETAPAGLRSLLVEAAKSIDAQARMIGLQDTALSALPCDPVELFRGADAEFYEAFFADDDLSNLHLYAENRG